MAVGQDSNSSRQNFPKVWTNIERFGVRGGFGGLQLWKENPGQEATLALPGGRIQCQTSPVREHASPLYWQAGLFRFVSWAEIYLQVEELQFSYSNKKKKKNNEKVEAYGYDGIVLYTQKYVSY